MNDLLFFLYMILNVPLIVLGMSFVTWKNEFKALGVNKIIRLEVLLVVLTAIVITIKRSCI